MGYLIKDEENEFYTIGASEGGHQDYTVKTKEDYEIREFFKKSLGNEELSIERVLSGQGLMLIYKYLKSIGSTAERDKELEEKIEAYDGSPTTPEATKINMELTSKGITGECQLSRNVLELFIGIMGDITGDMSLFICPTSGIYLVGGLSSGLEPLITENEIFMEHFLNKDNFSFLLKSFPIYIVKNDNIGMIGAAECARRLLLKEKK